jgi:hypothetical protein
MQSSVHTYISALDGRTWSARTKSWSSSPQPGILLNELSTKITNASTLNINLELPNKPQEFRDILLGLSGFLPWNLNRKIKKKVNKKVADWLVRICLGYLITLFQLQRLYRIKQDEKIVNSKHVKIRTEVIVVYFKVLSCHLTRLIWENYGKQWPAYSVPS